MSQPTQDNQTPTPTNGYSKAPGPAGDWPDEISIHGATLTGKVVPSAFEIIAAGANKKRIVKVFFDPRTFARDQLNQLVNRHAQLDIRAGLYSLEGTLQEWQVDETGIILIFAADLING